MADQQSGTGHGATIMRFGSGSLQIQGGASSNSDVGVQSRFVQSPAANSVPSLQGR
jgi:hypothetical protein